MNQLERLVKETVIDVPDFPCEGIIFRDITPILSRPEVFSAVLAWFEQVAKDCGATKVAGIESRGFLFATPVAHALGLPCLLIRKPGKLPRPVHQTDYALEYGTDTLEIHRDDCAPGDRVLLIDDLLATGGTVAAAARLVEMTGASIAGIAFVIELTMMNGRGMLKYDHVAALARY